MAEIDNPTYMEVADELIRDTAEVLEDFTKTEILPLIRYQQEMEQKAFNKAYSELKKLEEEA